MSEIERKLVEPRRSHRRSGDREHFEIPGARAAPDQLETGLVNLPLAACALDPTPDDGAFVTEAHRHRRVREPRRYEACDLRRHVGAERDDFSRFGLYEAENLTGVERTHVVLEHVGVLEGRDAHRFVAEPFEAAEQRLAQSAS